MKWNKANASLIGCPGSSTTSLPRPGSGLRMLHVLTPIAPCRSVRYMNSPDPVTLSVLDNRCRAIVDEMGEAMLRTAYSQILNSSRDFSIAICDAQARL